MRKPSSVHPANLGLFPGTKPLGTYTRRGPTSSWHGVFASEKALGPSPFRSLLERDLQVLLTANPDIRSYAVEPHVLTFFMPNGRGGSDARTYTPDVVVIDRRDRIAVIDAKAKALCASARWQAREPLIREAYAVDHGVAFVVLDEDAIRLQPRLSNCEVMLRHREPGADDAALMAVRDAIAALGVPTTIGAVTARAGLVSAPGEDRAFTALMRLALVGEIALDLSAPFSAFTTVDERIAL